MPLFLSRNHPLPLILLGILIAGLLPAAHSQTSPSSAAASKLRNLLPFPEAVLTPDMEMTMGLGYSLDQGYHFYRQSSDYAGRIVGVQRQMTGGIADAPRYRLLGNLYRQADLSAQSHAGFQESAALYQAVLAQRPNDGPALAG